MNKLFKILSLILMITTTCVWAQDDAMSPDQRSRVTYVNGDVVMQPSISGNTLEAVMNMPFLEGDRLATGADGVIEFRLGDGVTGWGWYETKIELTESIMQTAEYRESAIKLWYGAIAIRSLPLSYMFHRVSVDLGTAVLNPDPDSLVRITMESDLTAVYVTVVNGGASLHLNEGQDRLEQGETWRGALGATNSWSRVRSLRQDVFDTWYLERDRLLQESYEYTHQIPDEAAPAEYIDQAAALHGYGKWIYIESNWYWMPYVASGWMPYHAGFWDFISPWGWIWVPYEPWGWTVYHYGYWRFFAGQGWMWYPSWYWRGHYAHWRYNPNRSVHWIAAHPDDDMNSQGVLRQGAIPLNSRLAIGVPVEAAQTVDHMLNRVPVQRNANRLFSAEGAEWRSALPETLKPSMSRRQVSDFAIDESGSRTHRYGRPSSTGHETRPYGNRPAGIQPYRNPKRPEGIERPSSRSGVQAPQSPYRPTKQPHAAPPARQQPQQQIPAQQAPPQRQRQAPKPQDNKPRSKQPSAPSKPKPPPSDSGLSENVSAGLTRTSTGAGRSVLNLLKTGIISGRSGKGLVSAIGVKNAVTVPLSGK